MTENRAQFARQLGLLPLLRLCRNPVYIDTFLTLRLLVRRQPSLRRRQCETKTSASGTELYKIIIQLHPQCRILRKVKPLAQLVNSVYATSLLVQSCRGYPRVRAPDGFQSNTRLTHRFEGKFATCIANFQ